MHSILSNSYVLAGRLALEDFGALNVYCFLCIIQQRLKLRKMYYKLIVLWWMYIKAFVDV